jgi:competence protein ComEA
MMKLLDRLALPIGIVLLIGLLVGACFLNRAPAATKTDASEQIVVDIAGAVNNPGVYQFNKEAIVEDAITKAGGVTANADNELIALTINRAALLQNNGKVYIPIKGGLGSAALSSLSATSGTVAGLVNINSADAAALDTLPGIGPVYAGRIIDYRQKHGSFKRKEDLMKVSGISQSTFNKLKDKITI